MCGISGFNWKDEQKVAKMVQALSHRGPDADGIFTEEGISLGHNRLSVIDLSPSANQPMLDNLEELVIVYNGEIYNFLEIRKELESEYEFGTRSDTEVILAGYRKWGRDVVERLNGMFAFVIWDKRKQELFAARDHAGIKPFYYYWDGSKFIFGSEIKAILEHDVPRQLNTDALNHYLRVLYVPEPMTLIRDVYKLPPSHTLLLKGTDLKIESYGDEKQDKTNLPYSEATKVLRQKVMKAVERQLVADVPVGVYLSGGIDSSVVLAAATQYKEKIKTFSVGFELREEEERKKFNQDFELAKQTAEFYGAEHIPLTISVHDALVSFEEEVVQNDDLISNPTSIAMFLLAKHAKKEVTVALTGNGGDELFGGYDRYKIALKARIFYNTPDLFAKFMFQKDEVLSRVISSSFLKPGSEIKNYYKKYLAGSDSADSLMSADQRSWLPDQAFGLSDRMSMHTALEERVPLVDKELLSFSRTLPRSYKVDLFNTKKILKDAFKDDLPEYLFNQPKRGWFSPGAKWLRDPAFSAFVREILSENYYKKTSSLFIWPEVHRMLEKHIDRSEYNLTMIWAILSFQVWVKHYKIEL